MFLWTIMEMFPWLTLVWQESSEMESWQILSVELLNTWPLKFLLEEDITSLLTGGHLVYWPMKWCLVFRLFTTNLSPLCSSWLRKGNLNSQKKSRLVHKEKTSWLKYSTKTLRRDLDVKKTSKTYLIILGLNQSIEKNLWKKK